MAKLFSFLKKQSVTGRTVLFGEGVGRKDYEEKCRRDSVFVEDTDKFLAWKKPHRLCSSTSFPVQ